MVHRGRAVAEGVALALVMLVATMLGPPAPTTIASATAAAAPSSTGFVLPLPPPPAVLVPFAPPPHRFAAGHRGVDLAAGSGAMIAAAGPGRVVFAGHLVDRGVVSIEHDGGLRTTYEPVTASVTAGSTVTAGQPIGTLQPGHLSCAPASCLHWGARLPDGTYLDPLALLRPWPVRLWPWSGRSGSGP